MEESNNTSAPILDDGQYVDPLFYIAYSSPGKLQKVIYDFGGKPANSKEELYAMAAAMRAAPSGGKKFMKAVYSYAHPDTEEIIESNTTGKKCNCESCRSKSSFSGGCGCSSSYSEIANIANAVGSTAQFEKEWCKLDLATLQHMLSSRNNELIKLTSKEDANQNTDMLIKRIQTEISALKRCIEDKKSDSEKEAKPQKTKYFDSIPTWAKITGVVGTASLLTFGMIKIAQQASKK